jgi:sugar-phosphatase
MPEFQCSALLFDLDGVLVDSTPSVTAVWHAWAQKHGLEPARAAQMIHGRRTLEGLQILNFSGDLEAEARQIELDIIRHRNGFQAIPGAARLLRSLPADRWCVVTSGFREFVGIRLQAAGLPVPKVLVTADDVTKGKPHPEPYLKGAELLGLKPEQCMVVEDAVNGIRAGRAAGMKVIGVATTFPAAELREADAVVPTLEPVVATEANGAMVIRIV